jgi:hypothetical protein
LCVENNRSVNCDNTCQIAPFENPKQVAEAKYAEDDKNYTQEQLWALRDQESLNNNEEQLKTQLKTVAGVREASGITEPAGGGRMIRNKSSLRNHVTRKQNKQNKQRRKTKRRITRRTTRKRQRQGKRRRTKKRN